MKKSINLCDVSIKLNLGSNILFPESLDDFLSDHPTSQGFKLKVRKSACLPSLNLLSKNSVDTNGCLIKIKGKGYRGYLNHDNSEGKVEINSVNYLNPFLKRSCTFLLPKNNGLVIHASSLINDEKAYLFPGKADAGKTTIAKLSSNSKILSDELSMLRWFDEKAIAYETPFGGAGQSAGENLSDMLTGIYFPIKDKRNFLVELETKEALQKLLPNVVFPTADRELSRESFNLAYKFVEKLPCYDLHFKKDPSFWQVIEESQ